jgi:hypothetical protein
MPTCLAKHIKKVAFSIKRNIFRSFLFFGPFPFPSDDVIEFFLNGHPQLFQEIDFCNFFLFILVVSF